MLALLFQWYKRRFSDPQAIGLMVILLVAVLVGISVLIPYIGGMWGFWGVFFAIPLATLIKAVVRAWPETALEHQQE